MEKICSITTGPKIKSGSSGEPVDEKAASWRYFDRMSFLKKYIGSKK